MNKETTNQEELLQQKDTRIAELEKENEKYKEFFHYSAITRESHEAIIEERNDLLKQLKEKDQRIAELEKENKTAVKEFADKIDKLLNELKNEYSHMCKSQKEANQETCRYEGVCRVQNELNRLLKERGIE